MGPGTGSGGGDAFSPPQAVRASQRTSPRTSHLQRIRRGDFRSSFDAGSPPGSTDVPKPDAHPNRPDSLINHIVRNPPLLFLLACAPRPLSLHRYLKSGGKIVNFSVPLGAVLRDSTGAVMGDEPSRMEQLGVPAATVERSTAMVWQRPGYATTGGIGPGLVTCSFGDLGLPSSGCRQSGLWRNTDCYGYLRDSQP